MDLGFICANLPHTRPLAIRIYQRWRNFRSTSHSTHVDSGTYGNHTSRISQYQQIYCQREAFHSLESQGRPKATKNLPIGPDVVEKGDGNFEKQIGDTISLHEIASSGMPSNAGPGTVKIETEIWQEVKSTRMLQPSPPGLSWTENAVSTEISAQRSSV